MLIQNVQVGWLKNPSSMPQGVKQQLDAAGLTTTDYTEILKAHPFALGATTIDPKRYSPLGASFPYEPFVPQAVIINNVQSSTTTTNTQTQEIQTGVSINLSESIEFRFSEKLTATVSFQWTSTNEQSVDKQVSQSATVSIAGSSLNWTSMNADIIVYLDTIYSTFIFAFADLPLSAVGVVVDQLGNPAANKKVILTVGSNTFTGFTDSHGEYRFYNYIPGSGKLFVEGEEFTVRVGEGVPKSRLRLTGHQSVIGA